MVAVLQRVSRAEVRVGSDTTGRIAKGLLILLGINETDTESDAERLATKSANLRIFGDDEGKMNLSLLDVNGGALVVSQFTLCADYKKGRRPSFIKAAQPEKAEALYNLFSAKLESEGLEVQSGVFGAMMDVELVNDGPVTIVMDSDVLA